MKSVAIIVLNYNTPEMATDLFMYLSETLDYPDKDIYLIDHNSITPAACSTHRMSENLGFTRGMAAAYQIASETRDYDAYWFLNVDLVFENGNDILRNLVEVLFSNDSFAQISPQHNSPHAHMNAATSEAQVVPFLEATATLVKASTIQNIGFWDLDCTMGWGIDFDYGWRIRQAGLKSILTNRARITHKQKSGYDRNEYADRARAEMIEVLARKYGPDFMRITEMVSPSLSVCAIFRNEAPYLREWIEFHRMMGIKKFYLYQNRSEDNWKSVLQPYIEEHIVDLKDWPQMMNRTDGRSAQIDAYQDCIGRLRGQAGWLVFLDCDEFLFAPRHATVTEAISLLPQIWGAIGAHWMVFGGSGKTNWEDAPVIERFTWRPNETNPYNQWYKSIVRLDDPDLATLGSPHRFHTRNGTFNENGKQLTEDNYPPVSSLLRVNHYFTKSRKEWEQRHPADTTGSCFPRADERWIDMQAKDTNDRTIHRFLPALKDKLSVDISRALTIQGWMSEEELIYLAKLAKQHSNIAEIGSWRGRSTAAMGMNTHGWVVAVDLWDGVIPGVMNVGHAIFQEFLQNTKGISTIMPVRLSSLNTAALFKTFNVKFDVVFIDGDHSYESVKADILAWKPLLRTGGVLAGHDYNEQRNPEVVKAVNELVPRFQVVDSIWTSEEL